MEECVKDMIMSPNCPPFVINDLIEHWKARRWSIESLSHQITRKLSCKLSPKSDKNLWETQCRHEMITIREYAAWEKQNRDKTSPLYQYNPKEYSCYIDYKYIKDIAPNEILKDVDWGVFGFPERGGEESTLWIGTEGCYTNCHYDTYGFNLVAQIQGRKRWILFPPWESPYLYPTRIPYEESSVFSEVNIKNPDLQRHPLFENAHPYTVVLEPGQVLYVPHHWWHYVESLENSISVNTWIEITEDSDSRLSEAVTRCLLSPLLASRGEIDDDQTENRSWVNPGEEILSSYENMQLLQMVLSLQSNPTKQQKSNQERLCDALRNVPIRNSYMVKKRKRKNLTENFKPGNKKISLLSDGAHRKQYEGNISGGDDSEEELDAEEESDTVELVCSSGQKGPYIVIVDSDNKLKRDSNIESVCKFNREYKLECHTKSESENKLKSDMNLDIDTKTCDKWGDKGNKFKSEQGNKNQCQFDKIDMMQPAMADSGAELTLLDDCDIRRALFKKFVKSVTHPHVIQEIIKELKSYSAWCYIIHAGIELFQNINLQLVFSLTCIHGKIILSKKKI